MSEIKFDKWIGELGWEVMTWAPWCRKQAMAYDRSVISSFPDMKFLYEDFATEFIAHDEPGRALTYPKRYRVDGQYYRYGWANPLYEILIHARGVSRKSSINYQRWREVAIALRTFRIAFIGGPQDHCPRDFADLRGKSLTELTDLMAGARLTIGVSSGVMHLAAACGCNLVVWGDRRTYFGETLEQRYKVTWNPFDVNVGWINADNWQPEPNEILSTIEKNL